MMDRLQQRPSGHHSSVHLPPPSIQPSSTACRRCVLTPRPSRRVRYPMGGPAQHRYEASVTGPHGPRSGAWVPPASTESQHYSHVQDSDGAMPAACSAWRAPFVAPPSPTHPTPPTPCSGCPAPARPTRPVPAHPGLPQHPHPPVPRRGPDPQLLLRLHHAHDHHRPAQDQGGHQRVRPHRPRVLYAAWRA